jgi:endonuclease/exonuclease/phosphatase family metal-dependent hydrolase
MLLPTARRLSRSVSLFALALGASAGSAAAGVRIVTYNIDCSDQSIVAPNAGFDTVIEAIGNYHIAGRAQAVDVLALQELDGIQPAPQGNSATLVSIVNELNVFYGTGFYAFDPTADPTDGNLVGNGPSGLVYNTHTIQVIAATPIGAAPSSSGAPRQPMRYRLRPVGCGPEADFYLYVSHYKASSGTSNEARRNAEAVEIRQDADALGPSAHVIYAGDFNLTGGSAEPAYQTLVAPGNGKAYDPADSTQSWANNSAWKAIQSESSTSLSARFDFQLVSAATLNQPGLQLAPGSSAGTYAYAIFGNNGTTSFGGSTNSSGNTSLNDLPNASAVLSLLTTVSDHLPAVADYAVVLPPTPPAITQQPAAASACATGSDPFSVGATGTGTLTYQWQVQVGGGVWTALGGTATALPCGGTATATPPAAAATQIAITPCAGVNSYSVRCVVSNAGGSTPSNAAAYTVCYANCDCSAVAPVLNVGDFTCFLQKYAAGDAYANCDASTTPPVLNVGDFTCFLQKYAAGCP